MRPRSTASRSSTRNRANSPKSEPRHKRALAIREKLVGADHPEVAKSLNDLADLYADHARYVEAETLAKRALAIREQVLGKGHTDVAQTLTNLAHIHWHQGRYDEAEAVAKRAIAIYAKFPGLRVDGHDDDPELSGQRL